MADVTYRVVEHDGGWAYKVGDVFSETFRSRDEAHTAADIASKEQQTPGEDGAIEFQDAAGEWKIEDTPGDDRPATKVAD